METKDNLQEVLSIETKNGGSVGVRFPVPDQLAPITLSNDN